MKSIFTISAFILFMVQNAYCQTVRKSKSDTVVDGFFKSAKGCTVRYYGLGSYLCSADVFCAKPFELFFLFRDTNLKLPSGSDSIYHLFVNKELGKDEYHEFDCYAFVYPHRDPETQPDIHADNTDYPVVITTYKRVHDDTWRFIEKKKLSNLDEYLNFQYMILHNGYKK